MTVFETFQSVACTPTVRVARSGNQHTRVDQQYVKVIGAVLTHGLRAAEAARAEALEAGIARGDLILTVLARLRQLRARMG
jgi:hypothetical protein